MSYFEAERSEAIVLARTGDGATDRTRAVMEALVTHLHGFIKDVRPTEAEWQFAIDFLTETGQISDAVRQEWVLASDALGVSMLVDAINHPCPNGETETTVLGPFHVSGAPLLPMGADLRRDGKGERCVLSGRVTAADGVPLAGATLDIWSDGPDGFYDVQRPDEHPPMNLRGRLITASDGRYSFVTAKPVSYPIPHDGPVGRMLAAADRHPWRPAHVHFIVSAPGFATTTTHLFVAGDRYLESDAVFGVKSSLIVDFVRADDGWHATFDFVLRSDP